MEEEFYYEESNPKKTKIIILLVMVVIITCIVLFYMYSKKNTLNIKKVVTYEVGDTLNKDLTYYIKSNIVDETDYKINFKDVKTDNNVLNTVGEYTYKVKYKSISKTGKIKVVDTTAPSVEVDKLTLGVNEEINLSDFLISCEDYSKPCNVTYEKDGDDTLTKKEGNYKFNIVVSDAFDNKVKKEVNLVVKRGVTKETRMANDLKISYISPEYKDYDNTFLIKFNKAIEEDELFGDDRLEELFEIAGSDLHDYLDELYANNGIVSSDCIYIYNRYGYVIGFTIRVELDNKKVFYITK